MLQLLITVMAIVNLIAFLGAGLFFFKKPARPNKNFILLNFFGLAAIASHIFYLLHTRNEHLFYYYVGAIISTISLILFWTTLFYTKSQSMSFAFNNSNFPKKIFTFGPYKFVRHPFYTSYILAWFANPIIHGHLWTFIFLLILTFLYTKAAIDEEKYFLNSEFKNEYKDYIKSTGFFMIKF